MWTPCDSCDDQDWITEVSGKARQGKTDSFIRLFSNVTVGLRLQRRDPHFQMPLVLLARKYDVYHHSSINRSNTKGSQVTGSYSPV